MEIFTIHHKTDKNILILAVGIKVDARRASAKLKWKWITNRIFKAQKNRII